MTPEDFQQLIGEAQLDILNAYIASRSPNPGLSELGEPLTPDPKTTTEIKDELAPMMRIPMQDIVIFMRQSGFRLLTAQDGSLKWDIFRDMRYMM